jgi:hypothetical protein
MYNLNIQRSYLLYLLSEDGWTTSFRGRVVGSYFFSAIP